MQNCETCSIVPAKSLKDHREYLFKIIQNKIKILLISDAKVSKSECSVSVGVGTSLESESRSQGLAHFLEHMLFMGSQKFPSSNQYSQFINQNGGADNAYTDFTQTNYYFEIKPQAFFKAVEMISEFFKGALFTKDCIEKQIQAVHQQWVQCINDDSERRRGILCALGKGQFTKFQAGNNMTLNHKDVRDDLIAFYNNYYSSNVMNVVLVSNHSIQDLEQLINVFKDIPNKNLEIPPYIVPFEQNQLGKLIRIHSIKDEFILYFVWNVDYLKKYEKYNIAEYITHVLGHQGANSLFEILKNHGLATELTTEQQNIVDSATLIHLEIYLTEIGIKNWQQVYSIVNNYIKSIKIQQHIFDEIIIKNKLEFYYQEREANADQTVALATRMHHLPAENLFNYSLFYQYNQEKIAQIVAQLNPSRLLLFLSTNKELQNYTIQQNYKAKYILQNLPIITPSKIVFKPLLKNMYLPIDQTIYPQKFNQPRYIAPNLTFLQDYKFSICKGGINLLIHCPFDQIFKEVYTDWLECMLKQFFYSAQSLGIQIKYSYSCSVNIYIFGFNSIVLKIIQIFFQKFNNLIKHPKAKDTYQLTLQKLQQNYENLPLEYSSTVLNYFFGKLVQGKSQTLSFEATIQALQKYKFKKFRSQVEELMNNLIVEWVVVGNFKQDQIISLKQNFDNNIKQNQHIQISEINCIELTKDIRFEIKMEQQEIKTSGCTVYFQYQQQSIRSSIIMQIIKQHIEMPFFVQLRTDKKLAYQLSTTIRNNRGILGLCFYLISSTLDPYLISVQMKKFIKSYLKNFQTLSNEQFNKLKETVKFNLTIEDNNLLQLSDFINREVYKRSRAFNRRQKHAVSKQLESITKQEIMSAIQSMLRYSLEIYYVASIHSQEYQKHGVICSEFDEIKSTNQFHADHFKFRLEDKLNSLKNQEQIDQKRRRDDKSQKHEKKQKKRQKKCKQKQKQKNKLNDCN